MLDHKIFSGPTTSAWQRGHGMQLKNNILIDEETPARRTASVEASGTLTAAAGLGMVYVFNCTPIPINRLSVNGAQLTPIPNPSDPGEQPQFVSANRFGRTQPVFAPSSSFEVTFMDGTSYTQTIRISQPPPASLTLWCFYSGLVLTDPYGNIRQISWGM
jgi:hypothetical protein